MKFTPKQYAQALYLAVSESKPDQQDKILDNFVKVLKANQALGILNEIEKEYLEFDRETRGIKTAIVATARELSSRQEGELIKELNQYVKGQVELKKKVDQGLLGGVVIKIGDELIDGSVKRSLKELREQIENE